ncbi:GGDEF domain-containing protein [Alginatibacterium sediminis]|nr:GGDEF domain-containing protein [Alginatibacterium sediminis]
MAETAMLLSKSILERINFSHMTHRVYLLMLILLSSIHAILFAIFGAPFLVSLDFVVIIIYGLTLLVIEARYPLISRTISHFLPLLHCFAYCTIFLSRDSGMFLYLLALVPASFLFFERRDYWLRTLLTFFVFVLSSLSLSFRITPPWYQLDAFQNGILTTLAVGAVSFSLYLFYLNFSRRLEDKNQELIYLAQTDSLTKLSNRRHFIEQIKLAIHAKPDCAVLLIDLDHFKNINDSYGHFVGDIALAQSAELFSEHIGNEDLVARLGGEEFAIMIKNCSPAKAVEVAQQIRGDFEAHKFKAENDLSFHMTLSIGISRLGSDYQSSLSRADRALYQAKQGGRNQVILAE